MKRTQILLVGVGGQGVLTAAQILGAAAHADGVPAVVGQLHGMSQRGGSVEGTIILGDAESSMLIGDADGVIAFEALEALRALPRMGPATRAVVCTTEMVPFEVVLEQGTPPPVPEILAALRAVCREVREVDAKNLARDAGEGRTLNTVMLGAAHAAGLLPIGRAALEAAIAERCGAKYVQANKRAFALGSSLHGS